MAIPLDTKVKELTQLPYTISYVIRKMQQIDNLSELPKEKRPTDEIIWDGTSEELEDWLDRVLSPTKKAGTDTLQISVNDIEG